MGLLLGVASGLFIVESIACGNKGALVRLYLLIIACSWPLFILSSEGKPESSQSDGFSFLFVMISFLKHISSSSVISSFLIWSLMTRSVPSNQSNTLSLGQLKFVTSTLSATWTYELCWWNKKMKQGQCTLNHIVRFWSGHSFTCWVQNHTYEQTVRIRICRS